MSVRLPKDVAVLCVTIGINALDRARKKLLRSSENIFDAERDDVNKIIVETVNELIKKNYSKISKEQLMMLNDITVIGYIQDAMMLFDICTNWPRYIKSCTIEREYASNQISVIIGQMTESTIDDKSAKDNIRTYIKSLEDAKFRVTNIQYVMLYTIGNPIVCDILNKMINTNCEHRLMMIINILITFINTINQDINTAKLAMLSAHHPISYGVTSLGVNGEKAIQSN